MTFVDQDPDVQLPEVSVDEQPKTEIVDYDPFAAAGPKPVAAEKPTSGDAALAAPKVQTEAVDYDPFAPLRPDALAKLYDPDKGIDYKTGGPYWTRVQLQRASNPNEAKLALEKLHGPGNYGQDAQGRWWISSPDAQGVPRKIAVMPGGSWSSGFGNMGAGMQAASTPMAGAGVGAAVGTLGGPFAPLTVPAGAGIGAAAGWSLDQAVKYYQGLYDQSPQEFIKHANNEAALNALFAGALPTAKAAVGGVGDRVRRWLGTTPTTESMTERLTEAGARVPIASAAPHFKSFQKKQELRNMVMGDPGEEQNVAYLQQRMRDTLRSAGMDEAQITDFMSGVTNTLEASSTAPAGRAVASEVQARVGAMAADAQASRDAAAAQLRTMESVLRHYANSPVGRLGQDVADNIIARRREFGDASRAAYQEVHHLAGGEPIVPLDNVFARSQHFVDLAEPGLVPQYIRSLAERGQRVQAAQRQLAEIEAAGGQINGEAVAPEVIQRLQQEAAGNVVSLAEAHEIRSNLRELLGHNVDLTRTPYYGKIQDVANTADNTITALARSDEIGSEAAQLLRQVDNTYRQGIARFYNDQIKKLVSDARSGLIPDAELVASTVVKDGRTEAANEILAMMPQNIRDNIGRVDIRNMVQESSRRGRDGNMTLDGMKFLDLLDQRRGIVGLHSPQAMADMRMLAQRYAALDGKIDVTALPPSQFRNRLAAYVQHTRDVDEFVKGNPVGAFLSGRPDVVDRAVKVFTTPGNEAATAEAANYFRQTPEGLQTWALVQQEALRDLLRSAVTETPSRVMTISGPNIENVLKGYTRTQQELLFPGGLANDLKEVAKEARFLFPHNTEKEMMGLSANAISLHVGPNIFHPRTAYADARYLYTGVMGWVTDRPAVLRFLADARRTGEPGQVRAMLGGVARWIGNEEMMGPGKGRPTQGAPPSP